MIEKFTPSNETYELFSKWNDLIEKRLTFCRIIENNKSRFEDYSLAPSYENKDVKIEDDKIEITYSPIGLSINSRTPDEISLSIIS